MEVWPVQHAKARFSELLDACQREGPQVVSRRGIETAVLVPIEEWRGVQARALPSLKALLLAAEPRMEALAAERGKARRRAVVDLGGKGVST
jgi:prevent-host-death family protein